jgi:hypothetical protein
MRAAALALATAVALPLTPPRCRCRSRRAPGPGAPAWPDCALLSPEPDSPAPDSISHPWSPIHWGGRRRGCATEVATTAEDGGGE